MERMILLVLVKSSLASVKRSRVLKRNQVRAHGLVNEGVAREGMVIPNERFSLYTQLRHDLRADRFVLLSHLSGAKDALVRLVQDPLALSPAVGCGDGGRWR